MMKVRNRAAWRRTGAVLIAGGIFFSLGAAQLRASPFDVPAITRPASNQHHVGKVIWLDLRTTDLAHAKQFYAGLFGWDFRDYRVAGADYAVATVGGRPVAGLLQRAVLEGEQRRSAWLPFIAVKDVDATVRNALSHRANIREVAENRPLRGREALLTDPEGIAFVIEASSSGDPPDAPPTPGNLCGTSLYARDPGDAAVFYQQLFGYQLEGLPANGGFERARLSSGGRLRINVNAWSEAAPELSKRWINFVCVANVADATAQAVKLGGRVLVATQPDGQRVSVIMADPTGAPFGMAEIPSTASAGAEPEYEHRYGQQAHRGQQNVVAPAGD